MGKEEVERTDGGVVVVVVNPKPNRGIASKAIDWLETLIVKYMFDPSKPNQYLSGNFGPVSDETPPCKDLPVIGHLPECLNGEFVKIGDLKGLFGLLMVNIQMLRAKLKVLDVSYGTGTNVLKVLEDGDLQTLGMLDYDKRLSHSFTAHPKVDPFTANAWEEGDEIVLITCRIEDPDLGMVDTNDDELLENFTNELYEMRFNMKTSLASQKKLSAPAVDFPKVNESYVGRRKNGTIMDSIAKITGIVKFDLHAEPETGKTNLVVGGNVRGIFNLGAGRFGSEATFVPRQPGSNTEEDDGYLILFVHDESTGKSSVNVIDARTMSADPVAVVELPHRVPYGFHALFVTE
ncbi:hypothetical protein RJ640_015432, partial [Escallonia rubra]